MTKLFKNTFSVTLKELSEEYGKGFSVRKLKQLIQQNKLKQNIHYQRSNGETGIIRIDPIKFQEYLNSINKK